MIPTTEFRLGNWIQNKNGSVQQIISITKGKIWADGIDITIDVLFKCGFKIFEEKDKSKSWRLDGFKFKYTHIGDLEFYFHRTIIPCKHLHQLQNIYYAFKGVELKIDLNFKLKTELI